MGIFENFNEPIGDYTENKVNQLEQRKQQKLNKLSNGANLDDSYTQDGDVLRSNKNKIWNEADALTKQLTFSKAFDEQVYRRSDEVNSPGYNEFYQIKDGKEVPYQGDVERLYGFSNDSGGIKVGTARGDLPDSKWRYEPGKAEEAGLDVSERGYGWESTPDVVDTSKKLFDVLLPRDVAVNTEAFLHGNKEALANRLYNDPDSLEAVEAGNGKTEVYKSVEGLLGDTSALEGSELDGSAVDFSKYLVGGKESKEPKTTLQEVKDALYTQAAMEIGSTPRNYKSNLIDAAQAGGVQLLAGITDAATSGGALMLYKGAQALGHPEWYTKEDKELATQFFNKYKDSKWANKAVGYDPTKLNRLVEKGVKNFKDGDYLGGIASFAAAGPETFASSLAYMGMVMNYPLMATVVGSEVNDSIEAFVKNNEREPNAKEIARMALVDTAKVLLEKIPFERALKGTSAAESAFKKLITSVPKKDRAALAKGLATKVGTVGLNVGEEMAQEGAQYAMDYFNREYGTKNDKGFNTEEFLTSAGLGGAAGGFTGSIGQIGALGRDVLKASKPTKIEKDPSLPETEIDESVDPEALKEQITDMYELINGRMDTTAKFTASDLAKLHALEKAYQMTPKGKLNDEGVEHFFKQAKQTVVQNLDENDKIELGSTEDAIGLITGVLKDEGFNPTEEVVKKLTAIAKGNGLSEDFVQKSIAEVGKEATVGERGYLTKAKALEELEKEPEKNAQAINRLQSDLARFQATQSKYADTLEEQVKYVEAAIREGKLDSGHGFKRMKTKDGFQYEVEGLKTLKGTPYVINVVKSGDSYQVHPATKKQIEIKRQNAAKITEVLNKKKPDATSTVKQRIQKKIHDKIETVEELEKAKASLLKALQASKMQEQYKQAVRALIEIEAQKQAQRLANVEQETKIEEKPTKSANTIAERAREAIQKDLSKLKTAEAVQKKAKEIAEAIREGKYEKDYVPAKGEYTEAAKKNVLKLLKEEAFALASKLEVEQKLRQGLAGKVLTIEELKQAVVKAYTEYADSTPKDLVTGTRVDVRKNGRLKAVLQLNVLKTANNIRKVLKPAEAPKKEQAPSPEQTEKTSPKESEVNVEQKEQAPSPEQTEENKEEEKSDKKETIKETRKETIKETEKKEKVKEEQPAPKEPDSTEESLLEEIAKLEIELENIQELDVSDKEKLSKIAEVQKNLKKANKQLYTLRKEEQAALKQKQAEKAKEVLEQASNEQAKKWLQAGKHKVLPEELSEKTRKQFERVKAGIAKILPKILKESAAKDVSNSPARLLMVDGKYPPEVIEAMAAALTAYLGERFGELRRNDDQQISKMLGITGGYLPAEVRQHMQGLGRYLSNEADGLGRVVLKNLGIKAKNTAAYDLDARMAQDLGATLFEVLRATGYVDVGIGIYGNQLDYLKQRAKGKVEESYPEKGDVKRPIYMVKMNDKYKETWVDIARRNQELVKALEEESGVEGYEKKPRFWKRGEDRDFEVRNAEQWTDIAEYQEKALNIAEKQVYRVLQDKVELLKQMWGETGEELTKAQIEVAKLFGWEDTAEVHVDYVGNVEAKNREIVRSITDLLEFAKEAERKDVYFDYFFSKNGRFFIDSSKINPQTDKLHRFLITAQPENRVVKNKRARTAFKIAVVQAFDGSGALKEKPVEVNGVEVADIGAIDKQDEADTLKQFEALRKEEWIVKAVKSIRKGKPDIEAITKAIAEVDHPSHALLALVELSKYTEEGEFITDMVIETDAVTSGFALGLLTNPIMTKERLQKWLAKTGVWIGEKYASFGSWKADKKNKDSYETGAEAVNKKIESSHANRAIVKYVGKVNRSMMKYPLMIFVYGAGMQSIARALGNEIAENLVKELSLNENTEAVEHVHAILADLEKQYTQVLKSNKAEEKEKRHAKRKLGQIAKVKAEVEQAKNIENGKKGSFRQMSMVYRNSPMAILYELVSEEAINVYGDAIGEYLEEEFDELVDMRKTVNEVFTGAFGAFKKEYDRRLAERTGVNTPTKKQIDEVLEEMKNEGRIPGILTVDAKEKSERAVIMDTEKRSPNVSDQRHVKPWFTRNKVTLHPLVYELVASPTSGAVTNIHYLDGAIISRLIAEKTGLGIHDAFVSHVNDVHENAKRYNKAVWKLTQKHNMLEQVYELLLENMDSTEFIREINRSRAKIGAKPIKDAQKYLADLEANLLELIDATRANKQWLTQENVTIAHMAGPEGSIYEAKGKGYKAADVQLGSHDLSTIEAIVAGKSEAEAKQVLDIINREIINCKG